MSGSPPRFRLVVFVCVTLIAGTCFAESAGSTIEGRWRLVEQSPGEGRTEQAAGTPALRLELSRGDGGVRGEVWIAGREGSRARWPVLFREDEPIPVRVLEHQVLAGGVRVFARYEASDAADGGRVLDITEDYRLAEDGAALVGTVTVRLRDSGGAAGAYVVRRRFERDH